MLEKVQGIEGYLLRYGRLLGRQAERSLDPLHVPGRDAPEVLPLLRRPFEAQAHVITAAAKALRRQDAVVIAADVGTGKTLCAMVAAHAHARGRPYRALVFCPGQIVKKWERELRATIPGVKVRQLQSWRDVAALDRHAAAQGPEWFVIGRDRAKLGARWRPAFLPRRAGEPFLRCPHCFGRLCDKERLPIEEGALGRKRSRCEQVMVLDGYQAVAGQGGTKRYAPKFHLAEGCGGALWQMTGKLWRYEPALYIKRRLKGYFDYLVADEVHEERGASSAQGNALGALAAACAKAIALTGTLSGGLAEHLRPLLFRLAPASLVREGLAWSDATAFTERYGRIETSIIEREKEGGADNRESRGRTRSQSKKAVPGIMPPLFGRHLVDKCIFLSLAEVAEGLPSLTEEPVAVDLDEELAVEYGKIDSALRAEIRHMIVRGDKRLLGAMLQTLLAYPDNPHGWDAVGYYERGEGGGRGAYHAVCRPANLNPAAVRPKERTLIELCKAERDQGRQVWVYVEYTDRHDVQGRLQRLLKAEGLRVGVLRASVDMAKREAWIARHAPECDVIVSHPALVGTGLDFFSKSGGYNFPTLVFYELPGYDPFKLRQAAGRSRRIGQWLPCRVYYLYYRGTLQENRVLLMGRKLAAAAALEGKFLVGGLVSDDGESMEMALARSLAERISEGDVRCVWGKLVVEQAPPEHTDGAALCRLMRAHRVTIRELATRLGISQARVRRLRAVGTSERVVLAAVSAGPGRSATPKKIRPSSGPWLGRPGTLGAAGEGAHGSLKWET